MLLTKRAAVALAAAAALAAPSASPAHADQTGLFNVSFGNCGVGWRQYCAGYGQGVPVGLSTLAVATTCSATSPFVVDRTAVRCYIVGMDDGARYLDTGAVYVYGNEAVASRAGFVPFQGYWLCVEAGYSTSSTAGYGPQNPRCL